jgi:hypothetical protein
MPSCKKRFDSYERYLVRWTLLKMLITVSDFIHQFVDEWNYSGYFGNELETLIFPVRFDCFEQENMENGSRFPARKSSRRICHLRHIPIRQKNMKTTTYPSEKRRNALKALLDHYNLEPTALKTNFYICCIKARNDSFETFQRNTLKSC